MQARTQMEARIIERMGRGDERTMSSVLALEAKWVDHLKSGGLASPAERRRINGEGRSDPFWFDRWESVTGAAEARHEEENMHRQVQALALKVANDPARPAGHPDHATREDLIAQSAIRAARLNASLTVLSMTTLPAE